MRIAIYQNAGRPGDKGANLDALAGAARRAAGEGAELLVLPEMYLTGYNIGETAWDLAEPLGGPSADRAAAIAREHRIALLYGYPEREGDGVHNAALLLDAGGARLANYRKTHLYGADEKHLYRPGEDFVAVPFAGLTLGILICYDIEFPEPARLLALRGVDLIAVPTALPDSDNDIPARIIPARAHENQLFVAYANHCGTERGMRYCGRSRVSAPDGRDLASAGEDEALLVADIEPAAYAKVRAINPYLEDRRPDLYGALDES